MLTRVQLYSLATFTGLAFVALLAPKPVSAAIVNAAPDVFTTLPPALGGNTNVVLPGPLAALGPIALEGANELQFCAGGVCVPGNHDRPLTPAEVIQLQNKGVNGLVSYVVQFVDVHGSVVTAGSQHAVGTSVVPVLDTSPNFDTVVMRLNALTFTAPGQVAVTPITIEMLNLESVLPITIAGFHYRLLLQLLNGPVDPQQMGNLTLTSTSIDLSGVHGTVDMGFTNAATSADLGVNGLNGHNGLPVAFMAQFLPLDGGPGIGAVSGNELFTNNRLGTFGPIPEPASSVLIGIGIAILGSLRIDRGKHRR